MATAYGRDNVRVTISGQEQLGAELRRLWGPELRTAVRVTTRDAMEPVLEAARERTPVLSGRLQASLGELAASFKTGATARVGTRRDFTFNDTSGTSLRSGRTSTKSAQRAFQGGASKDAKSVNQYGSVIHFGVDSDGRIRRTAGPAPFLEDPIEEQTSTIIGKVENDLRAFVENH